MQVNGVWTVGDWDDIETSLLEEIRSNEMTLSGRGGRRACWCCPKGGPLTSKFVPSGLKDFVGDDKNHLLCSECAALLEEARAKAQTSIHPQFQAMMNSLLPENR